MFLRSNIIFLIIPLLLGGNTATAQETDKALLWEITGKDLKKPSYLYGTIHIQSAAVFNYDPIVEEKIKAADAFAMELLMDELDPVAMMSSMIMKGNTLDKLLSPDEYSKIDKFFKDKMGVSLQTFNSMKPFLIYSQFVQYSMPKDKDLPLDMHFLKVARENEKKAFSIESFEDQMGALNSISLEDQTKILVAGINDTIAANNQFTDLVNTYLEQDIEKMVGLMDDPSLPKDFSRNFLIKRNKKMAETMIELINKQPTFSAVGAGHLGGPDGLLQLLRKAGYTVKPVKFDFKN